MTKRITYILGLMIGLVLILSNSSAPPVLRSGAPDQGSCADLGCHSSMSTTIQGRVDIEGLPDNIEAGEIYNLTVSMIRSGAVARNAGFQMSSLNKDLNGIGRFVNAGDNVGITNTSRNRTFVQHSPAQNFNNDSTVSFSFSWQAPDATDLDTTTFYLAANLGDGNGAASGDRIILEEFTLVPMSDNTDIDNDGFDSDTDCDDMNPNINPNASEIPDNDIDENCDGIIAITNEDNDSDGFDSDIDCDDMNPNINPEASEIPGNDIDEDCDGIAQANTVNIVGRIVDSRGNPINKVIIDGGNNQLRTITDVDGRFTLSGIDTAQSVIITLTKEDDLTNGVTGLDIVRSINHILDRNAIVDDNVRRAADVNGDGRISSLDLVFMTNIILLRDVNVSRTQAWLFDPDRIDLSSTVDVGDILITGYKLGDLNGDADPSR